MGGTWIDIWLTLWIVSSFCDAWSLDTGVGHMKHILEVFQHFSPASDQAVEESPCIVRPLLDWLCWFAPLVMGARCSTAQLHDNAPCLVIPLMCWD